MRRLIRDNIDGLRKRVEIAARNINRPVWEEIANDMACEREALLWNLATMAQTE